MVPGWSIWKEAAADVEPWSVTLDHRPSIFSFSSFKGKSGLVAFVGVLGPQTRLDLVKQETSALSAALGRCLCVRAKKSKAVGKR